MSKPDKIYCLFSLDNNYDQPPNNLVCFWHSKPTLEQVANGLSQSFPGKTDEETLAIVNIWNGQQVRLNDTNYWVQQVAPMKLVVNQ